MVTVNLIRFVELVVGASGLDPALVGMPGRTAYER
jgi:hypothetical protein